MSALARRARLAWRLALASQLGLLLAITCATLVWPSDGREPNGVIWALLAVPLLILMPGLWRGGWRTHAWAAFVSMLYFMIAVPNLFKPGGQLLDGIELVCSILLFLSTTFYIRWSARARRESAADDRSEARSHA